MHAFTIKDLENLSGIKAHTIRIWEQRYHFLNPSRTDTNIRYYSNDELKTLLNIALLNKFGFKISHIDRMSPSEMSERILSLSTLEARQEKLVNDLIRFLVDTDIEGFEAVLSDYIQLHGIGQAIQQIIFPFLDRVGTLWMTSQVNPAQEHIVTNLIRQKLIAGIEKIHPLKLRQQTAVLFLPEGEFHELGLLFVQYLLKSRGVKLIYLGANMPIADLEYLVKLKSPDFVYTHLTSVSGNFNFEKFLQELHQKIPQTPLIISGLLTHQFHKTLPAQIQFKRSMQEVIDFMDNL